MALAEDPDKGWEQMAPFFLHETNAYGAWRAQDDLAAPFRSVTGIACACSSARSCPRSPDGWSRPAQTPVSILSYGRVEPVSRPSEPGSAPEVHQVRVGGGAEERVVARVKVAPSSVLRQRVIARRAVGTEGAEKSKGAGALELQDAALDGGDVVQGGLDCVGAVQGLAAVAGVGVQAVAGGGAALGRGR